MLVEKYVLQPRHVEIQVFADQHGNAVYLAERDCSIQRRHQKVVEEAPAPGLSPELRRAMGEAAVTAVRAIGYVGAGTVEFLLDARGEFFFMEMNTRLQVEHPVTELITGQDLVAWQLRVAQGQPLPLSQEQIVLRGHAIEVRLYAEDPEQDFLPASGELTLYREPAAGVGRRVDSGVVEGDRVSPFYDPMLSKLIAWGEDRETARRRLLAMLAEQQLGGVHSNLAFLRRVLAHPAFAAAELDTGFIARHAAALLPAPAPLPDAFWALAARAWLLTAPSAARADDPHSPWAKACGLRLGLACEQRLHLRCGEAEARALPATGVSLLGDQLLVDGRRHAVQRRGQWLFVEWDGQLQRVTLVDPISEVEAQQHGHGGLSAPMNGSVVRVLVEPGQQVAAGELLVVVEALKMEHSIRAAEAGEVTAIHCAEGDLVEEGRVLVALQPLAEEATA